MRQFTTYFSSFAHYYSSCLSCHRHICNVRLTNLLKKTYVHFVWEISRLWVPFVPLHPPFPFSLFPYPGNCRLVCFPIEFNLMSQQQLPESKLRTTYRRGICYRGSHQKQHHLLYSYTQIEPLDNNVLVGKLPFCVKCVASSSASTAVYPL